MKKAATAIIAVLCCIDISAQRTPSHNFDFERTDWSELASFFDSWQPGMPPPGVSKIDDEFFISRQRPLERISDDYLLANAYAKPQRKLFLWTPLDDPSSQWKALPRYTFEGDNFSMWQYVDSHGNWSAPWLRVAAGISDAAAKNGVSVGCVLSIPWNATVNLDDSTSYDRILKKFTEKASDGTFRNSAKLARLMRYYGINALGVNSEFNADSATMALLRDFFADVHRKAADIGWRFELQWYDITDDSGCLSLDRGLGPHNRRMFGSGDSIVADRLFANYNWTPELLKSSADYARAMRRSPYDYYAGFDIQGRALKNRYWQNLIDSDISIGIWGAHSQNLIHQSATDDGSSGMAIQKAYLRKQELIFSGGNRNPAVTPPVRTDCSLSNVDLQTFHGLARLLTAKSTIQSIPFVTRFNMGNGHSLYRNGRGNDIDEWYNLGMQDILPTWRFWITDENDKATEDDVPKFVNAELSWDDSYCGGSCLRLSGSTKFSRIKLFKTKLATLPSYELSVTYRMNAAHEAKTKIFISTKDRPDHYLEATLPRTKEFEGWTTYKIPLKKLGLHSADTVALIGIVTENTDSCYMTNIGEIALRNPKQRFNPVMPKIKEIEVMRGRADYIDFKMRYAAREEKDGEKTYNDEVDTWYYEIYIQQKGSIPRLLTATESWAAYVTGAPLETFCKRECRFGVRAVAPDGQHHSAISWSKYTKIAYDTPVYEPSILRHDVNPGENFRISYADRLAPAAKLWKLTDAMTGETAASAEGTTDITTEIYRTGIYDLLIVNADGSKTVRRGYVRVANDADEPNSLQITDPQMLSIPADVQRGMEYTVALWIKPYSWNHDRQGTNIISKNTIADSWPYNNWGDLWVQARPAWTDAKTGEVHNADELSFSTMGCTDMDSPGEMTTGGYSITSDVWTHIAVMQDSDKVQRVYVNGRLAAGPMRIDGSTRRELADSTNTRINRNAAANIYIGGCGVYKAGFEGEIRDVQVWNKALSNEEVIRAMRGFADEDVPDALTGYYTFGKEDYNGIFHNHGSMKGCDASIVKIEGSGGEDTSKARYAECPDYMIKGKGIHNKLCRNEKGHTK